MTKFIKYRSYSFIDKDPIIDRMRTVIADEGVSYAEVHAISDVAVSTLYNWFEGKTRRPSHCTVAAVVNALGYELVLNRKSGNAKIIKLALEQEKRREQRKAASR
jgi:transcriptional regulator with XRE-family HTH domain